MVKLLINIYYVVKWVHGPAGFKNFDFHVLRKKNCPMTADGVRDRDINEQPCAVNPYKINTSYSIENRAFTICLH